MVERIHRRVPPRIYIREWIDRTPGLDQKRLAERMERTPGAISKKLSKPESIDAQWMADFAWALGIAVPDLFRDPNAPTPSELLAGLTEQQKKEVIDFAEFVRRRQAS